MKPAISEILRTGVRHAPLLLRVDRVVLQDLEAGAAESKKRKRKSNRVQRFYLTDDELVVQALLLPELALKVEEGDQLKIHRYSIRKAARKGREGHVIFFAIEDADNITVAAAHEGGALHEEEGGFIREPTTSTFATHRNTSRKRAASFDASDEAPDPTIPPPSKQAQRLPSEPEIDPEDNMSLPSATQESDDFETVTPDTAATQMRRQALREIDPNNRSSFLTPASTSTDIDNPATRKKQTQPTSPAQQQLAHPPQPASPTKPLLPTPSLTPLSALPTLAPSSPLTTLAIISWSSATLLRPSAAFPPKRHLKLHDISISHLFSGVSLAAYIDAANFRPARGTVALFRGVVLQRCGSGAGLGDVSGAFMLNAYANLPGKLVEQCKQGEDERAAKTGDQDQEEVPVHAKWYIDDEQELIRMGLEAEVDELKTWWEEREAKRAVGVAK